MDDQTKLQVLAGILDEVEFFAGEDRVVYARFELHGSRVTYGTRASEFRMWLNREALNVGLGLPPERAVAQALAEKEYKTRSDGGLRPVCPRFYCDADAISVHLAPGKVLEIMASGHEILGDDWLIFPSGPTKLCLPDPILADPMEVLPKLLGLTDHQTILVLAWMMALLQPEARLPILVITGPVNSGKTRLAAAIRHILDPSSVPIMPCPSKPADLLAAVSNNGMLVFDNVKAVPKWLAEDIRGLAEGTSMRDAGTGTMVQRKLATVLVCDDVSAVGDLARDAIVLPLVERAAAALKSRAKLELDLQVNHPAALGSIAGVAAKALAHLPSLTLKTINRDLALETWLLAVDTAMGLKGALLAAYCENGKQALADIVEANPVLRAFMAMLRAEKTATATATDMLALIGSYLSGPKGARWPKSGKEFAGLLRRSAGVMPDVQLEFDVRTGKSRDRNIVATLERYELTPQTKSGRKPAKPSRGSKEREKIDGLGDQAYLF